MKINWEKLLNPSGIDFKKLKLMSDEERELYVKDIYRGEFAKLWIQFTYFFHHMCMTGNWQYILAIWLM